MAGAVLMAIVLVFVIPVAVCMSGAALAALLGWSLKEDADARNEGSELIDLNNQCPDTGSGAHTLQRDWPKR
jgi:nitrogen fixation-related uncharacterized protein